MTEQPRDWTPLEPNHPRAPPPSPTRPSSCCPPIKPSRTSTRTDRTVRERRGERGQSEKATKASTHSAPCALSMDRRSARRSGCTPPYPGPSVSLKKLRFHQTQRPPPKEGTRDVFVMRGNDVLCMAPETPPPVSSTCPRDYGSLRTRDVSHATCARESSRRVARSLCFRDAPAPRMSAFPFSLRRPPQLFS